LDLSGYRLGGPGNPEVFNLNRISGAIPLSLAMLTQLEYAVT
jgi:hypothetical protein